MEQSFLITLFYSRDFPVVEYFKVSNFYHTLPVLEIWCIIRKALRKTVRVILVTYSLLDKSKTHTLSTCNHLKINQTVLVGHLGSLSSYRRGRHLQESIYIPLYGKLAISLELVLKSCNTYTMEIYLDLLCIILLLSHLKKKQTFPWTVDMFNLNAGYLSWCSLLWSRQFLRISMVISRGIGRIYTWIFYKTLFFISLLFMLLQEWHKLYYPKSSLGKSSAVACNGYPRKCIRTKAEHKKFHPPPIFPNLY